MTAPAAPTTKKSDRAMTDYVVLHQATPPSAWTITGRARAVNADAAIRDVIETKSADYDPNGTFVAVPARSWKPITVKTETKTVLTLTNGETS